MRIENDSNVGVLGHIYPMLQSSVGRWCYSSLFFN